MSLISYFSPTVALPKTALHYLKLSQQIHPKDTLCVAEALCNWQTDEQIPFCQLRLFLNKTFYATYSVHSLCVLLFVCSRWQYYHSPLAFSNELSDVLLKNVWDSINVIVLLLRWLNRLKWWDTRDREGETEITLRETENICLSIYKHYNTHSSHKNTHSNISAWQNQHKF